MANYVVVHRPRKYDVTRAAAGGRTVARFGLVGATGATGPNSISDDTDVGTLTNAVSDALSILATNAAGTKARRVALAAIHRAILSAADAAGVRSAIGTDAAGDTRPPAAHTHPLSALTQSGATSGQVPAWSGSAWVPATVSGGDGDMLSVLNAAEIGVTGATTLTVNRMHVCSGTSADYTVTLPAASGNAGRFVGVRMASGLTRLVTVDGNGSETIDGALTRVMWSQEAAILLCDGSNWFKVAGKSRPMTAGLIGTGSGASVSPNTWTRIPLNSSESDSTGRMVNTASNRIDIVRPADYLVLAVGMGGGDSTGGATVSAATGYLIVSVQKNQASPSGTGRVVQSIGAAPAGGYPTGTAQGVIPLATGDFLNLQFFASTTLFYIYGSAGCAIRIAEVPSW